MANEFKSCGKTVKAQSSLVLLESKAAAMKASSQVYGLSVHGDCENSYYGWASNGPDGRFVAGYACFNQ